MVSFGRNVINTHQYAVDDTEQKHVQYIKDLSTV